MTDLGTNSTNFLVLTLLLTMTDLGTDQADHDRRLEAFLRAASAENLTLK